MIESELLISPWDAIIIAPIFIFIGIVVNYCDEYHMMPGQHNSPGVKSKIVDKSLRKME